VRASQPPNSDDELAEARVAEHELEFVALLRAMVNHLMAAHGVESIADLPHAHELLCKAVEECAVEKGISHEAAAEIARRELGLPEPDA
jgi:hypothetical protein